MTARLPFRPVLTVLACAALALSLGGCGRKGPLDLPPQAQVAPGAAAAVEAQPDLGPGSVIDQATREREPETPRGPKRKFILDPLLGD